MSRLTQNRWFRRTVLGTVAAIGLGTAALVPTAPAKAEVWVGFGGPGYYYAPPPYYGPYAYPYDYYSYPAGGVYFGFGGWHHHWR